jgi:hypothetical protein
MILAEKLVTRSGIFARAYVFVLRKSTFFQQPEVLVENISPALLFCGSKLLNLIPNPMAQLP